MKTKSKTPNFETIASKLIDSFNKCGINCYIWHKATTGSIYIRFEDVRMCSIRIANHPGKYSYKYKYNLRSDISNKNKRWVKDGDLWRFYVNAYLWKELIPVIIDRFNQIQSWPKSKYTYAVPVFKLNQINNF